MEHQSRSSHEHTGDNVLVQRCLAGDAAAWAALADLVRDLVTKRLQGRGQWRQQDIEDMVQQMNLALVDDDYRLLRSYDASRARLRTFLSGVLIREAGRYARKQGREILQPASPQPAASDMAEEVAAQVDVEEMLQWAGSPTDVLILRLTAWKYRSQEIADILTHSLGRPITADNVRQLRARAKERLRLRFGDKISKFLD